MLTPLKAWGSQACIKPAETQHVWEKAEWITKQSAHNHQTVFDFTLICLGGTLLTDSKGSVLIFK